MMSEKQLNNTESKKLDSNSDEIIWELEHKKTLGFFYSWFARCVFFFGGIYYIVIGTQKYLSRDDRITAHFTTCFLSLVILRFLEKMLDEKYTSSKLIDCLRNMNLCKANELGYLPTYLRTDLTDNLHEKFGFRTDNEITTTASIKKILNNLKN